MEQDAYAYAAQPLPRRDARHLVRRRPGPPRTNGQAPEGILADIAARGGLTPHEFKPFDYLDPWKKKRIMSAGQPTDDSELAAALAESLIAFPGFYPEDAFGRLRSFIHDRKSVLTEIAYGSGGTLRAALTPPTYERLRCWASAPARYRLRRATGA